MVMMAVMTIQDDDNTDVDNDDEHHNDDKLIFTYTILCIIMYHASYSNECRAPMPRQAIATKKRKKSTRNRGRFSPAE